MKIYRDVLINNAHNYAITNLRSDTNSDVYNIWDIAKIIGILTDKLLTDIIHEITLNDFTLVNHAQNR